MADHALSTGAPKRARRVATPSLYTPAEAARRRAELLDIIDRAMALLDAIDAPFCDLEPEPDEEGDADEASLQPLAPALPVVRHRRLRRAA
ncbi:hypothetical protein [Roseomonas elaeocarpi]|uniref:Uncharacterized protein n=1 Tax=Roseomonas elaeocarpi TaxID=907779 RepID=A0ABV6JUS8_9PROT